MSSKYGLNLAKESWDANYSPVWEGVYTINEPHIPGGFSALGFINNRAFVFEVETPELGKHFLMSGIPGQNCIDKMKKLEADKGIPLKVVVTSGDYHHMSMKYWLNAYPQVKFVHSSIKFPQTRNGAEILDNPVWEKQIELTNGDSFPSLEKYRDTVQFFGFNQCLTLPDKDFTIKDLASIKANVKFLAIWAYHVPSKTLIFEHNFKIYINKDLRKELKLLGKLMLPTEEFASVGSGPAPKLPSDASSSLKHCQQMAAVTNLDVRAMMDYHVGCGKLIRQWTSRTGYQKEMNAILSKTGEQDPSGDSLVYYMNKKACFCC